MGACIILLKGGKNVGESSEKKSKSLVINLSPQFLFGCPMSTHEQKPRPHQNLSVAHRETRSVVCLLRPRTKAKKKRREKQSRSGSSALAFNHGAIMPRSCLLGYQHETKPITTALLPVLSLPELIGVGSVLCVFCLAGCLQWCHGSIGIWNAWGSDDEGGSKKVQRPLPPMLLFWPDLTSLDASLCRQDITLRARQFLFSGCV